MKTKNTDTLDALAILLSDTLHFFMEAREKLESANNKLKRAQLLMSMGSVYKELMDSPIAEEYFDAEQQLAALSKHSRLLCSYIAEVEKANRKRDSENPVLADELNKTYH